MAGLSVGSKAVGRNRQISPDIFAIQGADMVMNMEGNIRRVVSLAQSPRGGKPKVSQDDRGGIAGSTRVSHAAQAHHVNLGDPPAPGWQACHSGKPNERRANAQRESDSRIVPQG